MLANPSLRTARQPWSVLWAAVRRAVRDEVAASIMQTGVRSAWRFNPTGETRDPKTGLPLQRIEPPVSLELLASDPTHDPFADPPENRPFAALTRALTMGGWDGGTVTALVHAVADLAVIDNAIAWDVA